VSDSCRRSLYASTEGFPPRSGHRPRRANDRVGERRHRTTTEGGIDGGGVPESLVGSRPSPAELRWDASGTTRRSGAAGWPARDVEATLAWVHWSNTSRLMHTLGRRPPALGGTKPDLEALRRPVIRSRARSQTAEVATSTWPTSRPPASSSSTSARRTSADRVGRVPARCVRTSA
jgi:hypothetical protein